MRPYPFRNIARAARANSDPVYMTTGHFAPPESVAVWHLVTPVDNVLIVTARQGDREITLRILPGAEGGAC